MVRAYRAVQESAWMDPMVCIIVSSAPLLFRVGHSVSSRGSVAALRTLEEPGLIALRFISSRIAAVASFSMFCTMQYRVYCAPIIDERSRLAVNGAAVALTPPTTARNTGAGRLTTMTTNPIDGAALVTVPATHLQVH